MIAHASEPKGFHDRNRKGCYRTNGDNFQRVFFDEVRFADTLSDASPEPERAERNAK